ncbi:MAG: hypothetical protein ACI4KF_09455 [Huintestinicola sp.]
MDAVKENPVVKKMTEDIIRICDPFLIFYVSGKTNKKGELTGFKLCVVTDDSYTPESLETKLLLETECEIPCDFIVYNASDWNDYAEDDCSFAYRVDNGGVLLYGKKQ